MSVILSANKIQKKYTELYPKDDWERMDRNKNSVLTN